ncbi:hypothetical protein DOTSEDRAFT_70441 [Dothistroma septosporum NZE10]|uniref:Uncharacterized protein n=1 Tax=Dothistroma septosporum (strain NZE10 / CBS 128990) TaxID=675120 RepID=N1PST6_DOTSN|nr:hypothetical protein DOTSEDRAFT_70441 [Dothistroma septosporum NZE10]
MLACMHRWRSVLVDSLLLPPPHSCYDDRIVSQPGSTTCYEMPRLRDASTTWAVHQGYLITGDARLHWEMMATGLVIWWDHALKSADGLIAILHGRRIFRRAELESTAAKPLQTLLRS